MKKGFTLIELLAVIVILAIIALISSPIIIGIMDDARKQTFKITTYGIVKASEILYSESLMDGTKEEVTFTYTDGVESSSVIGRKLNYKGAKPKSGSVIINIEGQIAIAIHDGKLCAEKGYDESQVILTEKAEAECIIEGTEELGYQDATGASIPKVSAGMIPILHNGTNWVKADTEQKWYDYDVQEWANAALVTESSRAGYLSAATGTVINEADVLAYLVWIPRYKYKLFNVGALVTSPQEIEIVFEDKSVTKSSGSTNGTYLTHPAFTLGTTELSGIWVGKFETTGTTTTPTIKPTVRPLWNITPAVQYETAAKLNNATTYGLTTSNDAHMMKNIEWGAVTYLYYSKYGKYGNTLYTGGLNWEKEIWKNPSQFTGCAGWMTEQPESGGCMEIYSSSYGVKASTTGNIYGVYDMSGGSYEYVMGASMETGNASISYASSGFNTTSLPFTSKYVDKYLYGTTYNDQAAYNRRILGDATGETRGWYNDTQFMLTSTSSWLLRGGGVDVNANSGAFSFEYSAGYEDFFYAFRIAISS